MAATITSAAAIVKNPSPHIKSRCFTDTQRSNNTSNNRHLRSRRSNDTKNTSCKSQRPNDTSNRSCMSRHSNDINGNTSRKSKRSNNTSNRPCIVTRRCSNNNDNVYTRLALSLNAFFFVVFLSYGSTHTHSVSAAVSTGSIFPNFTATYFRFIDQSGVFLLSPNAVYAAAIANSQYESAAFYLFIHHYATKTVVWTANRNTPISNSGKLRLSPSGLAMFSDSGDPVWSTPPVNATVAALELQNSGNLRLIDSFNNTLWQSFDYPTDTIVSGQRLPAGKSLIASKSDVDFSEGDYELTVTSNDGVLRWQNLTYYRLLMDSKSIKTSNKPVSYLTVNGSGFFLIGDSPPEVAVQVLITPAGANSGDPILKISGDGQLIVMRYTNGERETDFTAPGDGCRIPMRCGKLGLCSTGGCSCPAGFHGNPTTKPGCSPSDAGLSLPESCGQNHSNSPENYTYIHLGAGIEYFLNGFTNPAKDGVKLTICEDLCTKDCSCLGFFHGNQSGSCYLLENDLGSMISSSVNGVDVKLGFIKALSSQTPFRNRAKDSNSGFPIAGLVALPASGVLLILIIIVCWTRSQRGTKSKRKKNAKSFDEEELELFSLPGLPVRFDLEDLVEATENFSTQIGSGGFGTVYKGVLRDKTVVAVKKITAFGAQGKKEFCTEIAIIGNIHHVNLVRLKGFCAQGLDRFLVYEYMSRGSLDRTLFGSGPPLEWGERFEIALGTARGLAYLHRGCDNKIIHCDVKPENILLSENMHVKISDFGLSKLLSPEQSGWFTTMRGTRGYLAPEWLTNTAISDKTDVYSYGMVLLELIRGRKNCVGRGSSPNSEIPGSSTEGPSSGSSGSQNRHRAPPMYFPLHALEMHEEGRYLDLIEPRLDGRVTSEEAEKLVKVALCCLHEDPTLRPTMTNVVGMLEGVLPVGEPKLELLNFLRFYGRRFTEVSTVETGAEVGVSCGFMTAGINSSSHSASLNSLSYISSQQVSGPR